MKSERMRVQLSRRWCSHSAVGCTSPAAPCWASGSPLAAQWVRLGSHLAKSHPTKCFGVTLAGRESEGSQPTPPSSQGAALPDCANPKALPAGKCCEPLMEQPPLGHGTPHPRSCPPLRLTAGQEEQSFDQEGTLASLSAVPRGNVWTVVPIMRGVLPFCCSAEACESQALARHCLQQLGPFLLWPFSPQIR